MQLPRAVLQWPRGLPTLADEEHKTLQFMQHTLESLQETRPVLA